VSVEHVMFEVSLSVMIPLLLVCLVHRNKLFTNPKVMQQTQEITSWYSLTTQTQR